MAVNEGLYNWMLKTYGMPAAEWYRSNPGSKPGANPFLPRGAYVPLADAGSDNTYASVSPEFEEVSVVEPGSSSSDYFQQFLNSLDPSQRADIEGMSDLSAEDKANIGYDYAARQQLDFGDPLASGEYAAAGGLYYTPNYGEYGGYLTKNNPDQEQVARVRDMMAQQAAGTADPSWANQNLSNLISVSGLGGWHVRGATANDPEVQKYGIYNVGRSDYMQTRRNEALQKNIELLKKQADQGIQDSQQFLDEYIADGGEGTEPQYGPRGEILGDVAVQYGDGFPKTPGWMKELDRLYKETKDKPFKPGTPKPGRGMGDVWEGPVRDASAPAPVDVRVARAAQQSDEQKQKLAQQSEFDMSKEKQFASAKAAEAYRKSAATEDPFRAAARMG